MELRFFRQDGHEIAWEQLSLSCQAAVDQMSIDEPISDQPSEYEHTACVVGVEDASHEGSILLSTGRMRVAVSHDTGLPCRITYDGVERLAERMEPTLWRPLNDNELGSGQHVRLRTWRTAGRPRRGGHLKMQGPLQMAHDDGAASVRGEAVLTPDGCATMQTVVTLRHTGELVVTATITPHSSSKQDHIKRPLCDEAAICLRTGLPNSQDGKFLDCDSVQVRARWDDPGAWQQMVVRHTSAPADEAGQLQPHTPSRSGRPISYGDTVCFTLAHTGKYLSTAGGKVAAIRVRQGEYGARPPEEDECFVVESLDPETAPYGSPVHISDAIRLRAASSTAGMGFMLPPGTPTASQTTHADIRAVDNGDRKSEDTSCITLGCIADRHNCLGAWTIHQGDIAPPTRIGLEMALVREHASHVAWHGRGPHESYPDRHAGARLGVWEGSVGDQAFR